MLDVASLASVTDFARRWDASGRPLHVLINNAGVMSFGCARFSRTAGGQPALSHAWPRHASRGHEHQQLTLLQALQCSEHSCVNCDLASGQCLSSGRWPMIPICRRRQGDDGGRAGDVRRDQLPGAPPADAAPAATPPAVLEGASLRRTVGTLCGRSAARAIWVHHPARRAATSCYRPVRSAANMQTKRICRLRGSQHRSGSLAVFRRLRGVVRWWRMPSQAPVHRHDAPVAVRRHRGPRASLMWRPRCTSWGGCG